MNNYNSRSDSTVCKPNSFPTSTSERLETCFNLNFFVHEEFICMISLSMIP
jgi:hypothetical protein